MAQQFDAMTYTKTSRRDLLRKAALGAVAGAAALAMPQLAHAEEHDRSSKQVLEILDLLSAFHLAKNLQDIDLMMSLWADDATLTWPGQAGSPFVGKADIQAFLGTHGSFIHKRYSLTPSYKNKVRVDEEQAFFYLECHDVGGDDATGAFSPPLIVVSSLFLAGTVREDEGEWLFAEVHAGSALPLSTDHDYYP